MQARRLKSAIRKRTLHKWWEGWQPSDLQLPARTLLREFDASILANVNVAGGQVNLWKDSFYDGTITNKYTSDHSVGVDGFTKFNGNLIWSGI